jgi:ankyrin repeat protein
MIGMQPFVSRTDSGMPLSMLNGTGHYQPSMIDARFPQLRALSFDRDGIVGSALHMAVIHRNIEGVCWLTQLGLNPNGVTSNGESALHLSIAAGSAEIASHLIRSGAHLNAADEDGDTPLHWAVRENSMSLAMCLLAEQTNGQLHIDAVNEDGESPLHLACSLGDADMTSLLLQHGANPNLCNASHFTALDEALANGHSNLVPLLQKYNAVHGARVYASQGVPFAANNCNNNNSSNSNNCSKFQSGVPITPVSSVVVRTSAATAAAASAVAIAGSPDLVLNGTNSMLTCSGEIERQQLTAQLQSMSVSPVAQQNATTPV